MRWSIIDFMGATRHRAWRGVLLGAVTCLGLAGIMAGMWHIQTVQLRATAPPPLAAAEAGADWLAGPALTVDGFRLVTLQPRDTAGRYAGPYCCTCLKPGFVCSVTNNLHQPTELQFYQVDGEMLRSAGHFELAHHPFGTPGTDYLGFSAWPDGRALCHVSIDRLDGFGKAEGPVKHHYALFDLSQGPAPAALQQFVYTSADPAAVDPLFASGRLTLAFHDPEALPGPFALDIWHCQPGQPGVQLPRLQATEVGWCWRAGQPTELIVDSLGAVLVDDPATGELVTDTRWAAAGKLAAQATSRFRQVALTDSFMLYGSEQGFHLHGLDGSTHLISSGTPRLVPGPNHAQLPAADCCGENSLVTPVDGTTLLLMDNTFQRLTLIRRQ